MKISEKRILPLIKKALREDIGRGDITSRLIVPAKKRIEAAIIAKESGVVCGLDAARLVFQAVDKKIRFRAAASDGKKVKKGEIIARLEGDASNILKAERVALNFLGRLSGIATKTSLYVQRVKPYRAKIMDTRKTTPGLRGLEKYAVRCGGGFNHRMGLWDQVLVKDNHLSAISLKLSAISLKDLIRKIKKKKPKGMKIEVEVKNLREFKQALEAGPDIVMLDNMSIKNIKKAVAIRKRLLNTKYKILTTKHELSQLEVSGGVNLDNVRQIAACGVERISIGALTHSALALDISLEVHHFRP